MIRVRMVGDAIWCGRPGCRYPNQLATMHRTEDGEPWAARLQSNRWRRERFVGGPDRYVMVKRTGRRIQTRADGTVVRSRNLQMRAELPCIIVCPGCEAVQAIDLT